MRKVAIIWFLLFCLCNGLIMAEDLQNTTIALTPNLDSTLYSNTKYTSLFKLEIKDKKPCSPKDTVMVFYNITTNNSLIKEDSFSKEVGCTSSANTGEFTSAGPGEYEICGMIINSSASFVPNLASCIKLMVADTSNLSCDINLQLKTSETFFFEKGQSIEFKPELNDKSFPFTIGYWIEDFFGNIVKPKINTTNTNEKSWKTNIEEQDRILFLKAVVYPSCADVNLSDNAVEKMFVVINNQTSDKNETSLEEISKESSIAILKITPEEASFGESVNTELEIYKGNTDKYSISVWVERDGKVISEKTKIHLKEKNTLYKFSIPVLLKPNCNDKIKEGDAELIVEGLGLQKGKKITLKGVNSKICPEKEEKVEKKTTRKEGTKTRIKITNQSLPLLSQSDPTKPLFVTEKTSAKEVPGYQGIVVYQSVSERSKNLLSWILVASFGMLSLLLAGRRYFG